YLNEPENAKRLFDVSAAGEEQAPVRARLLSQLLDRLELQEVLYHILASYEIQPIASDYCPPVHLQQLRKALVSKEELKQVEQVIKHVPAKKLSLKAIEELSRKIRRYSREEKLAFVLRFAGDFLRLRRDLRDAEHLTTCMERINLVTTEKARELSRLNNRLYECVLPEEARPDQDQVISHVIIKSDVRGSTRMTQDLLSRGLNPASHFSLNLHEPVKKLLDRYSAKKVFIEGDAIILAIFETESTVAYARPVAKACILSRQILAVCNSYNERASAEELDEFLVRYNMNGIELNDEGFQKLSEEISLDSIETKLDKPWGKEKVTLYYGEVPLGESVELLVLRKGMARQLLPDGKIGAPSSHAYYEVCTSPALYALVAAFIRTQQAAAMASHRG